MTIKTPLITTRYYLIIKELSTSVVNVALILKKHTHVMLLNIDIVRTIWLKRAESPKVPRSNTPCFTLIEQALSVFFNVNYI